MRRVTSHHESGQRYASLRFIGTIFMLLGVLLLIGGTVLLGFGLDALLSAWAGAQPRLTAPVTTQPGHTLGLPDILSGSLLLIWSCGILLSGLQFIAMGSLLRLVIHMEENTRIAAQCLERLSSRVDPVDQGVASMFRS